MFPLKDDFYYTCEYGNRINPVTGRKQFHTGIDIASPHWIRLIYVYAIADGKVFESKRGQGYGNYVSIEHTNGFISRYAHFRKRKAFKNQRVVKGQVIGIMGTTGRSTGRHLHFEIIHNGFIFNPQLLF